MSTKLLYIYSVDVCIQYTNLMLDRMVADHKIIITFSPITLQHKVTIS